MHVAEINALDNLINQRVPEKYWRKYNEDGTLVLGQPFFSGWKCDVWDYRISTEESDKRAEQIKAFDEVGFVGQFLVYVSAMGPYYYVNLPSMNGAQYTRGGSFNIGKERVRYDIPQDEMEAMLDAGWKKIQEISGVIV